MKPWLAIVLTLPLAAPVVAQASGPIALQSPGAQARETLRLASSGFQPNGPIPMEYSFYGKNISPPLSWSAGPRGTKAYALIAEDPDAPGPTPYVHWVIYDIPAATTSLTRAIRNRADLSSPKGAMQGSNSHGGVGYHGPSPPVGDPAHHYHFQLFALDRPLKLKPGADRDAVVKAMAGHVIARGELVGLYAQPAPKAPKT
jgi:Raf kinase inhibitor-like YbhB/YbcL family protein